MIPMILSQLVADADLRAKYSDEHYEEEVEELFRQKFSNNLQVNERKGGKGIEPTSEPRVVSISPVSRGNEYTPPLGLMEPKRGKGICGGIYRASSCKKVFHLDASRNIQCIGAMAGLIQFQATIHICIWGLHDFLKAGPSFD